MGDADTIAAVATAAGRAGIGVVRVSGPRVPQITTAILGRQLPARAACLAAFRDAAGEVIDRGIAIYFPAPASYTGEDVLELQGHGGALVQSLVLRRCLELGARPAQPGEFSRRAFLNDKIDLAQAEAVADLVDAATERAARSAARSLTGEFSRRLTALQEALTEARAGLEAEIDFPDEGIDLDALPRLKQRLDRLGEQLQALLAAARQGNLLRDGLTVALAGAPNVGKSTILNALSGDDVAIVTPLPGTTRDLLRSSIAIAGIPIQLVDSAGLRATTDPVERLGVERARKALRDADIVLDISDPSSPSALVAEASQVGGRVVHVHNKIDLSGDAPRLVEASCEGESHVWISAKTGAGMGLLKEAIVRVGGGEEAADGEFSSRQRHIDALRRAAAAVGRARVMVHAAELTAEELRSAQAALSEITGEHAADDLLGEIFARFCIGK